MYMACSRFPWGVAQSVLGGGWASSGPGPNGAPLGPHGPGPRGPLGPCGPGPYAPPPALIGRDLMGPPSDSDATLREKFGQLPITCFFLIMPMRKSNKYIYTYICRCIYVYVAVSILFSCPL